MFRPASQTQIDHYDRVVDSVIATCGGDMRGALKALLIANEYLEEELRRAEKGAAQATDHQQRQVA